MGWSSLWEDIGGSFPLENTTWYPGQVCTRVEHHNNLEWCGKGGADGSWAKYSCGQGLDQYVFKNNCDQI